MIPVDEELPDIHRDSTSMCSRKRVSKRRCRWWKINSETIGQVAMRQQEEAITRKIIAMDQERRNSMVQRSFSLLHFAQGRKVA